MRNTHCARCKAPRDSEKHTRCREKRRIASKQRYDKLTADGKCHQCGKQKTHRLHKTCKRKAAIKQKGIWKKRRDSGLCGGCGAELDNDWDKSRCRRCLDQVNRQRFSRKCAVLRAYGGPCSCCREDRVMLLEIDHIDGGGNKHRKKLGRKSDSFYRWLTEEGFPTGYQTLCSSCNRGRFLNGGVCPHKDKTTPRITDPEIK